MYQMRPGTVRPRTLEGLLAELLAHCRSKWTCLLDCFRELRLGYPERLGLVANFVFFVDVYSGAILRAAVVQVICHGGLLESEASISALDSRGFC